MAEGNKAPEFLCKSCNAELTDISKQCPSCSKPIDSAMLLGLATARVVGREERATMMPKLREAFAGGPSISPAARAHFARSGAAGRIAALRAVQASGDSSEFPTAVLESYYKKSPADLRVEIIRTLGAAGSEASVQVLQRILEDEKDERVSRVFGQRLDDGQIEDVTFPNLEVEAAKVKKKPTTFEREIAVMDGLPEPERPVSSPPPSIVAPEPGDEPEAPPAGEPEQTTEEISVLEEPETPAPPPVPGAKPGTPEPRKPPPIPAQEAGAPEPPDPPALPATEEPPPTPEPSAKVALPGGPEVPELPREPSLEERSAKDPHPVARPVEPIPAPRKSGGGLMIVVGIVLGCLVGAGGTVGVLLATGMIGSTVPADRDAEPAGQPPPEQTAEPASEQPVEEPAGEPPATEPAPASAEPVKLAYTATATSSHRKYPPDHLSDGDPSTVWQEDRKTKAENQVLTFTFEKPTQVARIGVVVGYDFTDRPKGDLWPLNNRLKSAIVEFPDGTKTVLEFEDDRGLQFKEVPSPGPVDSFTLKIIECYRGSWFRDNAIPEIEIWGTP
jgi:hypothetical protein